MGQFYHLDKINTLIISKKLRMIRIKNSWLDPVTYSNSLYDYV